jgi:hypothetical protein
MKADKLAFLSDRWKVRLKEAEMVYRWVAARVYMMEFETMV